MPELRFAPARGARLAYQRFGSGPATVVAVPPLAQNVEVAWERPEIAAMLRRLAAFSDYTHYDKRGTGSSDRTSRVPGLDERVDDLRAVMDHAGIERAHLFAQSGGGPTSLMFAATYPERVESVTLFGSGARLTDRDLTDDEVAAIHARQDDFARRWGTPDSTVLDLFAPSLAVDDGFRAWHQRYERMAAGADSLRELMRLNLEIDVREVLPRIDVPVLVLHRTGDRGVSLACAREVAAAVPDGRLVELPGDDHFGYAGDVEPWIAEVERFVTGAVRTPPVARVGRPQVRIVTLGRFAVEVDGAEVPTSAWGSRRARQLCKRLVVARGWPVTRDQLIELLWPDQPDDRRLGARLSVQLSAVRRVLGGGVVADRSTVALDLDEVATDLEALLRATDDRAVVDAFTGELLPEDRYEDWTTPVRRETASRFAGAARRLAESAVSEGEHLRAVELAQRVLALDPYDETAHDLVVRALVAAGELGRARQAHHDRAVALGELGIEVEPFDPTPDRAV